LDKTPSDLLSAMIELRASSKNLILGSLGIPVQAWFLNLIRSYDSNLSAMAHGPGNEYRAYTVSSLLDDNGHYLMAGQIIPPGGKCWIRITSYDTNLSKVILILIRELISHPKTITLYGMNFLVKDVTFNPIQHPFANQTAYRDIVQSGTLVNPEKISILNFLSPTAFSSDVDIPLPVPSLVFRGYLQKWNKYAPESMQIEDDWLIFASSNLQVDERALIETQQWLVPGENGSQKKVGFFGKVPFVLLKKKKYSHPIWKDTLVVLSVLTHFSFYCGTGQHTTVGMGQTLPGMGSALLPRNRF
jgi:CRISPR-associated endoribonuclease Cas6